jgi:prepilin-type N-terminal cleavage/methylation domain-containing protein
MKKGLTLIELIIALGAAAVLASALTSTALTYNSAYIRNSKENREYFYSTEALMFIQHETENAQSVSVNSDIIELKYYDEDIKKYIKLNNDGNVVIIHMENNVRKASNNVITNISDFKVSQKSNTIYVSITRRNGEKFEKCIGIKTII